MAKKRILINTIYKTPEQVVGFVNKLKKPLRPVIGRILWWDLFACRMVSKRTSLFDVWLRQVGDHNAEPPVSELAEALIAFGYKPDYAVRRVTFGNTYKPGQSSKIKQGAGNEN